MELLRYVVDCSPMERHLVRSRTLQSALSGLPLLVLHVLLLLLLMLLLLPPLLILVLPMLLVLLVR